MHGKACGHQSPGSGPALNVTVAAHWGSGHTVVSPVNVPLPFESRHEDAGAGSLFSLCLLDSPRKYLCLLHVLLLYRGLLSLFWNMVRPRPCSVGSLGKSACVGVGNKGTCAAALAPVVMGALSKWPLTMIGKRNFVCVKSNAL